MCVYKYIHSYIYITARRPAGIRSTLSGIEPKGEGFRAEPKGVGFRIWELPPTRFRSTPKLVQELNPKAYGPGQNPKA